MPLGSMQTAINGQRDVGLTVSLEGPHAHGRLFVKGTRSDDVWDYPVMYVLAEDKQTFDLTALDDDEAAHECALQACRDRCGQPCPGVHHEADRVGRCPGPDCRPAAVRTAGPGRTRRQGHHPGQPGRGRPQQCAGSDPAGCAGAVPAGRNRLLRRARLRRQGGRPGPRQRQALPRRDGQGT
ncbi:hypothetical protein G6F32_014992 [Rhizopus arrhizus]|nr:hypothetical protein G6F32_014992 [Rhizopus arrhizus]